MKQNSIKTLLFTLLVMLSVSSCHKDEGMDNRIIIDPVETVYLTKWKEVEREVSPAGWLALTDGHELTVWSISPDTLLSRSGQYSYDAKNLGIVIDTSGVFHQTETQLSFLNGARQDTVARLTYHMEGDTALVISNASVQPTAKVRYRKIEAD